MVAKYIQVSPKSTYLFFQRWNSLLMLDASLGSTLFTALRLIWGTRRIKKETSSKCARTHKTRIVRHSICRKYLLTLKLKIPILLTWRLVPVILQSACGFDPVTYQIHPLSWNHAPWILQIIFVRYSLTVNPKWRSRSLKNPILRSSANQILPSQPPPSADFLIYLNVATIPVGRTLTALKTIHHSLTYTPQYWVSHPVVLI